MPRVNNFRPRRHSHLTKALYLQYKVARRNSLTEMTQPPTQSTILSPVNDVVSPVVLGDLYHEGVQFDVSTKTIVKSESKLHRNLPNSDAPRTRLSAPVEIAARRVAPSPFASGDERISQLDWMGIETKQHQHQHHEPNQQIRIRRKKTVPRCDLPAEAKKFLARAQEARSYCEKGGLWCPLIGNHAICQLAVLQLTGILLPHAESCSSDSESTLSDFEEQLEAEFADIDDDVLCPNAERAAARYFNGLKEADMARKERKRARNETKKGSNDGGLRKDDSMSQDELSIYSYEYSYEDDDEVDSSSDELEEPFIQVRNTNRRSSDHLPQKWKANKPSFRGR